jgi:hypothetical protein
MKIPLFLLIACLWTMASCDRKASSYKYDLDAFRPMDPQHLFNKIEVVLLDSIPDFPLTSIYQLVFSNNRFYAHDLRRHNILVYDKNGKFVRSIGAKGRGPGELADIRDFQINRFTGHIELMGNASPSIMIYDTLGTFIKKRNIGTSNISMSRFFHISPDLTAWLADDFTITVFSDKNQTKICQFPLMMDRVYNGFFRYSQPFSHHLETTYFYDTYSNVLYRFNDEILNFEVHKQFDFGKGNFDKSMLPNPDLWKSMSVQKRVDIFRQLQKYGASMYDKYIETDNYCILNKWSYNIFTRKKDNSVTKFNLLSDSINFIINNIAEEFAYSKLNLGKIDSYLNESMIGKEAYQKLKEKNIGDDNQEKFAIIKYWFK